MGMTVPKTRGGGGGGGGAGTVVGPASSTDGNIAVFDGVTGELLKDGTKAEADLVVGPATATDNAIVRYDLTTGKLVQNSSATVDDSGNLACGNITSGSGNGTIAGGTVTAGTIFRASSHIEDNANGANRLTRMSSTWQFRWNSTEAYNGTADTSLLRNSAGVVGVGNGSTGLGRIVDLGSESCLGVLTGADFNVTTDQAIALAATTYIVTGIIVTNASISLTTAAGGVYTAVSKGGTAIVAAGQVYSALTAATKYVGLTLEAVAGTDVLSATTVYLSLTTPQGAAATADVYVLGRRLT